MSTRNAFAALCIAAVLTGLGTRATAAVESAHVRGDHDGQHGMHASGVSSEDEDALRDVLVAIETGWETGSGEPFR